MSATPQWKPPVITISMAENSDKLSMTAGYPPFSVAGAGGVGEEDADRFFTNISLRSMFVSKYLVMSSFDSSSNAAAASL